MAIARCNDNGILAKMLSDAQRAVQSHSETEIEVNKVLGLKHMAPTFLLLVPGLVISIIILMFERILWKSKKTPPSNRGKHESDNQSSFVEIELYIKQAANKE